MSHTLKQIKYSKLVPSLQAHMLCHVGGEVSRCVNIYMHASAVYLYSIITMVIS